MGEDGSFGQPRTAGRFGLRCGPCRVRFPGEMVNTVRVLGLDTSLRSTGVGVVDSEGSRLRAVEFGRIRAAVGLPLSECLVRLRAGLEEWIARTGPQAVAIEGVFFCKNVRTAVTLGEARGVAIATCAARGLPVYEYAPRKVKQAVVGFGAAGKEQVGRMVMTLLSLKSAPPEDAGDALALAICHLHGWGRHESLRPRPI